MTLPGNSLRQTAHTHCASVHQAAKLVAALLRVVGVSAGLAESNGSLPSGLWLTSPAGWLPSTKISSGTLRSVIEYGLPLPFYISAVLHSHYNVLTFTHQHHTCAGRVSSQYPRTCLWLMFTARQHGHTGVQIFISLCSWTSAHNLDPWCCFTKVTKLTDCLPAHFSDASAAYDNISSRCSKYCKH